MTDTAVPSLEIPDRRTRADRHLYFLVWRWHFYAGLFVVPFLLVLALTGFVMLWFTAIAPEYGERLPVEARGELLTPSALAEAALAAHPGGSLSRFITPWDERTPAILHLDGPAGARVLAVDPHSGALLRDTPEGGTWNELAKSIHGTLLLGDLGDRLIEIAAGFGIVLVATGLYLWWPREGGALSLLLPDLRARGREFWKSLHKVLGTWFSLVLVFFLISGLAWTGVWGTRLVQAWNTFPAAKWDSVPLSDESHAGMNHGAETGVPWTLEQTPMPESGSQAGMETGTAPTLDAVVALARRLGFAGRFQVALPNGETGVYTISQDSQSYDSHSPTADRTVHVDRYTGNLLADVRFADYGPGAKAMAVGIALHEGMLGWWNVVLNAALMIAIVLICLSGVVMWWKRRPAGQVRLGAPPRPPSTPRTRGAFVLLLALALAFPLSAAVLFAVVLLDRLALPHVGKLSRLLS